jgi:hypothetical protein
MIIVSSPRLIFPCRDLRTRERERDREVERPERERTRTSDGEEREKSMRPSRVFLSWLPFLLLVQFSLYTYNHRAFVQEVFREFVEWEADMRRCHMLSSSSSTTTSTTIIHLFFLLQPSLC